MEEILRQVGHTFVQAVPTVVFVAVLVLILERLFFRPITAVLKARQDATEGAQEQARGRLELVEARGKEYDLAWQKARQEVYRQREADRRNVLATREALIRQAREQADSLVREAQSSLAAQAERARAELGTANLALAEEIAGAVLGAGVPASTQGGVSH